LFLQTDYNDPDAVDADMELFGLRPRTSSRDNDGEASVHSEPSEESGAGTGSLESMGLAADSLESGTSRTVIDVMLIIFSCYHHFDR
jgi:hypothetical protein